MLDGFDDAVVVITGGASGIGRGIALEASRRGARVAVADMNDERLATTLAELEAGGTEPSPCTATSPATPRSTPCATR